MNMNAIRLILLASSAYVFVAVGQEKDCGVRSDIELALNEYFSTEHNVSSAKFTSYSRRIF